MKITAKHMVTQYDITFTPDDVRRALVMLILMEVPHESLELTEDARRTIAERGYDAFMVSQVSPMATCAGADRTYLGMRFETPSSQIVTPPRPMTTELREVFVLDPEAKHDAVFVADAGAKYAAVHATVVGPRSEGMGEAAMDAMERQMHDEMNPEHTGVHGDPHGILQDDVDDLGNDMPF